MMIMMDNKIPKLYPPIRKVSKDGDILEKCGDSWVNMDKLLSCNKESIVEFLNKFPNPDNYGK